MNDPLVLTESPARFPRIVDLNAFYYFPENEVFVRGRHGLAHVANPVMPDGQVTRQMKIVSLLLFVIAALGTGIIVAVSRNSLPGVIVPLVLCLFLGAFFAGRTTVIEHLGKRHNAAITRKFLERGTVLQGTLLTFAASPIGNNENTLHVEVGYDFINPGGDRQIARVKADRPALNGKPLPIPGTTVYVLYFSDNEYYLL